MDLGISGKRALVLASSQGLGLGVATKLCEEGVHLLICSTSGLVRCDGGSIRSV
jgi:3-oxoacyl-[acyl-carrier protein] reductase